MTGLSAERRLEERWGIIDRFYDAYRERVARAPEGHAMDYVHIYLICSKV